MTQPFALLSLAATLLQGQAPQQFGGTFETLLPEQKNCLTDLAGRIQRTTGKKVDIAKAYNESRLSDRTTFEAVTHALITTKLASKDGKPLGKAFDLVDTLDYVAGEVPGARGDRQFRLYVYLKPNAMTILDRSKEFERGRDNTIYHKGYPQCYRLKGGPPSVQVSLSADGKRADIDVDYRSSKFPASMVNGHLTSSNSDVRAGNNEQRHNQKWTGFAAWWKNLFNFGAEQPATTKYDPPPPRVTGKAGVDEAMHDFLKAWLVEQKIPLATAYLSRQLSACAIAEAERDGRKIEPGVGYFALVASLEKGNRQLGKVTKISEVARPVVMSGQSVRPAKNQYSDEFTVVELANHVGEKVQCGQPIPRVEPPSKLKFGDYYASAFRVKVGGRQGTVVYFLWTRIDDQWKVTAMRSAEELAPALTPAATVATVAATRTVVGDPEAIGAIRAWLSTWIIERNADKAMAAFTPQSYACVANDDPQLSGRTESEWAATLKRGLGDSVKALPTGKALADSLEGVDPAMDSIPLVEHKDKQYFSVVKIPDAMGRASDCRGGAKGLDSSQKPTYNDNYYASLVRLKVGGEAAAFYCLWNKTGGAWKIKAWSVEAP